MTSDPSLEYDTIRGCFYPFPFLMHNFIRSKVRVTTLSVKSAIESVILYKNTLALHLAIMLVTRRASSQRIQILKD